VIIDGSEGDDCGGDSSSREDIRKVRSWANFRTTRYGSSRTASIIARSTASCISRPLSGTLAISEFSVLCCGSPRSLTKTGLLISRPVTTHDNGYNKPTDSIISSRYLSLFHSTHSALFFQEIGHRHGSSRARGSAERVDQVGRLERV
jgi:hypothetical protein